MEATATRQRWLDAVRRPAVWRRAALLAGSVGLLQAAINQGDHWFHLTVDAGVVVKTILTPVVTFAVAFVSAAWTGADQTGRAQVTSPDDDPDLPMET